MLLYIKIEKIEILCQKMANFELNSWPKIPIGHVLIALVIFFVLNGHQLESPYKIYVYKLQKEPFHDGFQ